MRVNWIIWLLSKNTWGKEEFATSPVCKYFQIPTFQAFSLLEKCLSSQKRDGFSENQWNTPYCLWLFKGFHIRHRDQCIHVFQLVAYSDDTKTDTIIKVINEQIQRKLDLKMKAYDEWKKKTQRKEIWTNLRILLNRKLEVYFSCTVFPHQNLKNVRFWQVFKEFSSLNIDYLILPLKDFCSE